MDNVEECLICVKELFSVPDTRALKRERGGKKEHAFKRRKTCFCVGGHRSVQLTKAEPPREDHL